MLNNFKISMGKNLFDLFKNDKEYTLELFRLWRETISSEFNCEIEPIEFTYNQELNDSDVQIIDKRIEDLQFLHNEIKDKKDVPVELIEYYNLCSNIGDVVKLDKMQINLVFDNLKDKGLEWLLTQMTIFYQEIYKQECKLND